MAPTYGTKRPWRSEKIEAAPQYGVARAGPQGEPLEDLLKRAAGELIELAQATKSRDRQGDEIRAAERPSECANDLSLLPAEEMLAALLDSVGCGVLLFDAGGKLCAANESFAEIVHMDAARVRECGNFEALAGRLAPQFANPSTGMARWRERFQRDEISWDEIELLQPERKIIERFGRPVFDGEGRRLGWIEIHRDVTRQRLIESKQFHADRMAALGELVSGIAHELNNPLTSIAGYAQLLVRHRTGPDREGYAQRILNEAERAGRIARNLLLFAHETQSEYTRVSLNEIAERALGLRSYEHRRRKIRVDLELDPNLPQALGDAAQLQQVLLNLIVNAEQALQFAAESTKEAHHGKEAGLGRIWVSTRRISAQSVAIEVADEGPGIAPEIAPRIFDPFFTTKPPGEGTGLGLSIVFGIVREHGGQISAENRRGRGAVFTVELPIAGREGSAASSAPPVAWPSREALPAFSGVGGTFPDERSGGANRHRELILVVEDEPTVSRLIADVLREEGYMVDTVLDSREGLELVRRRRYDLVICDLRMPCLDGRSFYRELVREGNPLEHRMMFVTGDTLAPRTVAFLEKSGRRYLAKPFLVDELKDAVHDALAAAGRKEPAGFARQARHGGPGS